MTRSAMVDYQWKLRAQRAEARIAQLEAALRDCEAFLGVMYGNVDGVVPPTVKTPLGIPVNLGAIMADVRSALTPSEEKPA